MISKLLDNPTVTKIFSLFIAVLIWLFVGAQNPETELPFRNIEIKVVTQNAQVEDGVSVVEMKNNTVDVTLRGSKNVLSRLSAGDIYATIEVDATAAPGYYNLPVNLTLPVDGVTVTGKNPAGIDVWLDRTSSVTVPIRVTQVNRLGDDYVVEPPTLTSETMEIFGPASRLTGIDCAQVEVTLTDQNMGEPLLSLPFTLLDEAGEPIEDANLEPALRAVTLSPNVFEKRTLPVSVSFLNRPEGWLSQDFSYTISPRNIEMLVPASQSVNVTDYDAGVIDLSMYPESDTVKLLISNQYLEEGQPEEITVDLHFSNLVTTKAELSSLGYDNKPEEMAVSLLTPLPLSIELRGTAAASEKGIPEHLRGIVDLSDLNPGETKELPVKIITGDPEIGVLGSVKVTLRAEAGSSEE